MIEHHSSVQVRYAETDMMGIVYHGSYLPWLEIARTELLKHHGLPYRELEADGYLLPVLEVNLRYLKSAYYDDTVEIISRISEKPGLRIRINYELMRNGELIATGQTLHAFIDRRGKPVRPPARFVERMNQIFG